MRGLGRTLVSVVALCGLVNGVYSQRTLAQGTGGSNASGSSNAGNVASSNSNPTRVTEAGKFTLNKFCSLPSGGGLACGNSITDDKSLKQYLANLVKRDLTTVVHLYYLGQEAGPVNIKASDVPVCDLGRGLQPPRGRIAFNEDGSRTRDVLKGGEGNFFPGPSASGGSSCGIDAQGNVPLDCNGWHSAQNYGSAADFNQEVDALANCYRANPSKPEACSGRNHLMAYTSVGDASGSGGLRSGQDFTVNVMRLASCGRPCKFIEGRHKIFQSSDAGSAEHKDVFTIAPNSCTLEYAWVRGLWPRAVWSAATAPADQPLKMGSAAGAPSFSGVIQELNSGEVKLTSLSSNSGQTATCGALRTDIDQFLEKLKEAENSFLRLVRQQGVERSNRPVGAGAAEADPQLTCPSTDAQLRQFANSQSALNSEVNGLVRRANEIGLGPAQSKTHETAPSPFTAAACHRDAIRYQMYNAIGKLLLCEIFNRARGKFELMVGENPDQLIVSLTGEVKPESCPRCSDGDENIRTAAYAVTMRNWFTRRFIHNGQQPLMPTSNILGSDQPPVR